LFSAKPRAFIEPKQHKFFGFAALLQASGQQQIRDVGPIYSLAGNNLSAVDPKFKPIIVFSEVQILTLETKFKFKRTY
jgi:hypothetical protein